MHPALKLNRKTWIISDTHFGHANIIKYCGRPYNHNTLMLRNWELMIADDDYVLHLGDVTFWHRTHVKWAHRMAELPGKKFLIRGNHDRQWTDEQWRKLAGFTVTEPFVYQPDTWECNVHFSHEPAMPSPQWEYNVHGHSHNHSPFRKYDKLQATYYNVSVEATDYKPIKLGQILDELRT